MDVCLAQPANVFGTVQFDTSAKRQSNQIQSEGTESMTEHSAVSRGVDYNVQHDDKLAASLITSALARPSTA